MGKLDESFHACRPCNGLHSLYISKGFERMAASSSNASPVRRKNTATAGDITHILKAGLPEGLSAGVVIESSIEDFIAKKELLLRELLLVTSRPTKNLMVEAGNASFQEVDSDVVRDFANRTVEASQYLYQKLHQSSSGKKLSNAVNRLLQIVGKPKSKTSFARIGQACRRMQHQKSSGKAPVVELDEDKPAVKRCRSSFGSAGSSSSLGELAASYGLAEIPARAKAAASESSIFLPSSPEADDAVVVIDEEDEPAASAGPTGHEVFDFNKACLVRHVAGKCIQAKMHPGENGFMVAEFANEPAKETEITVLLWQKCKNSLAGKFSSKEKPKAKAKGKAKAKANGKAKAKAKGKAKAKASCVSEERSDPSPCMKKPAAADAEPAAPLEQPKALRWSVLYYSKDGSIGVCKFWKDPSQQPSRVSRKQICAFRKHGWDEKQIRKAGEALLAKLRSEEVQEADAKQWLEEYAESAQA